MPGQSRKWPVAPLALSAVLVGLLVALTSVLVVGQHTSRDLLRGRFEERGDAAAAYIALLYAPDQGAPPPEMPGVGAGVVAAGAAGYLDRVQVTPGSAGYLVDGGGQILAGGGDEASPGTTEGDAPTLAAARPEVAAALATSPSGTVDARGVATAYHASDVDGTAWQVVLVQPLDSLYAPLNGPQQSVGWALVGLLAVAGAAVVVLGVRARTQARALASANQELAVANARLEASNLELERFAYVASHDLQEPLRKVSSYCELLRRRYGGRLDEDADDFIGYAVDGAQRLQRLITDLLAYSRVGRDLQPTLVDAGAACADALEDLDGAIVDTGAEVTVEPLPTVWADRTALVQLLRNLISNALKFRGDERAVVHVSGAVSGVWAELRVADQGIGIDPADVERVFEVFQRLHPRSAYPGTGIGLAICQRIAEQHGGSIHVESSPGEGATFVVRLPAQEPPP